MVVVAHAFLFEPRQAAQIHREDVFNLHLREEIGAVFAKTAAEFHAVGIALRRERTRAGDEFAGEFRGPGAFIERRRRFFGRLRRADDADEFVEVRERHGLTFEDVTGVAGTGEAPFQR